MKPLSKHGTRARYQRGCDCKKCKQANAAYHKQLTGDRQKRLAELPKKMHGKYTTYQNWGCRCDRCMKAWREAHQRYDETGAYA